MLRLAAGEANVDCFESAYPLLNDETGFVDQLRNARVLGFAGASCIDPSQVKAANQVFAATADEIKYAEGILAAAKEARRKGNAVSKFERKMIDPPLLIRARATLSRQ